MRSRAADGRRAGAAPVLAAALSLIVHLLLTAGALDGPCHHRRPGLGYPEVGRSIGLHTTEREGPAHVREHTRPVHPRTLVARPVLGSVGGAVHQRGVRRLSTRLAGGPRLGGGG